MLYFFKNNNGTPGNPISLIVYALLKKDYGTPSFKMRRLYPDRKLIPTLCVVRLVMILYVDKGLCRDISYY